MPTAEQRNSRDSAATGGGVGRAAAASQHTLLVRGKGADGGRSGLLCKQCSGWGRAFGQCGGMGHGGCRWHGVGWGGNTVGMGERREHGTRGESIDQTRAGSGSRSVGRLQGYNWSKEFGGDEVEAWGQAGGRECATAGGRTWRRRQAQPGKGVGGKAGKLRRPGAAASTSEPGAKWVGRWSLFRQTVVRS